MRGRACTPCASPPLRDFSMERRPPARRLGCGRWIPPALQKKSQIKNQRSSFHEGGGFHWDIAFVHRLEKFKWEKVGNAGKSREMVRKGGKNWPLSSPHSHLFPLPVRPRPLLPAPTLRQSITPRLQHSISRVNVTRQKLCVKACKSV